MSSSLQLVVSFAFAEIWSAMLESLFASPKSAIDPSELPYFFPSHQPADIFCDNVSQLGPARQVQRCELICFSPKLSRNSHVS